MFLKTNKSFTGSTDVAQAILHALDVLSARIDALEQEILGLLCSPAEAIERMRSLREGIVDATASQAGPVDGGRPGAGL